GSRSSGPFVVLFDGRRRIDGRTRKDTKTTLPERSSGPEGGSSHGLNVLLFLLCVLLVLGGTCPGRTLLSFSCGMPVRMQHALVFPAASQLLASAGRVPFADRLPPPHQSSIRAGPPPSPLL